MSVPSEIDQSGATAVSSAGVLGDTYRVRPVGAANGAIAGVSVADTVAVRSVNTLSSLAAPTSELHSISDSIEYLHVVQLVRWHNVTIGSNRTIATSEKVVHDLLENCAEEFR